MGILNFIRNNFSLGNTLYYPGCLTKFASADLEKNYIDVLNKFGLDFIHIPEFFCCGTPIENAGYKKLAEELREKNRLLFDKYAVKRIITNCPSCYHQFKKFDGIKVEHVTQFLASKLDKIEKLYDMEITYKEPCHLGRKSGIYDEPRAIFEKLGLHVVEQDKNRNHSMCCGAGGGLKTNHPELSNNIAKRYFKTIKTKVVVTNCPLCYMQLKENAPPGIKVYELSEAILNKIQ